jgi:GMP synthase (glutamine-hydrolysing)
MPKTVLVVEGHTPEHVLAQKRATGRTPAETYAAALRAAAPELIARTARPHFSDYDADGFDLNDCDGMAVTGSAVAWSAADERARPFRDLYEKAFAAGKPVVGSGWGLHLGAVVLGGAVGAGPNGVEFGFARGVTATGHPMHAGRRSPFDVITLHRDEVIRPPEGAEITASNAHTRAQAMAYERDGVSFWGVQYHPECGLAHVGHWHQAVNLAEANARAGAEIARIASDPALYADICVKHRIGVDILDRGYHMTELTNWVKAKLAG